MPNRLINEKSPYLLQHAHNPVDWYPWGEEAFKKAGTENKPIFLSIGYSTCHWCHVMEHESFENDSIAAYLNEHFVSIKLDREERPDIDAIYMTATQAMTGSGGWPMTIIMTPELKPFFCGTYFPPVPSHGRPSFKQLLERIRELWDTKRDELLQSADGLTKAISEQDAAKTSGSLSPTVFDSCFSYFERTFDAVWGGFGGAPKFPRPVQYDFLFAYSELNRSAPSREMALHTLDRMALGGLFDQVGGGFHRYSVDKLWLVSHFEKMLYDQAQLVQSFLDAYQMTGDEFYADIVRRTCDFVLAELTSPEGGFYSALDADSEGAEGTYYIWTKAEIEEALGKERAEIFCYFSEITEEGNWEHGKNIVFFARSPEDVAKHFGKTLEETDGMISDSLKALFLKRSDRIRPHLDDKILASWNGLMIGAMARAGDILSMPRFTESAEEAAEFIWKKLFEENAGKLLHRYRDGEARFDATLDTYAFLIKGYLDLYEATLDSIWLSRAITLQEQQDAHLFDTANGGYFTSRDAKDIIIRTKNMYDGAEPSGNSISVLNLIRLFTITGNEELKTKAEQTIALFASQLEKYPYTMPAMITAALWMENPPREYVFAGDPEGEEYAEMRRAISKTYEPRKVIYSANAAEANEFSRTLTAKNGNLTLYRCKHGACDLPITHAEDIS
jgi:hypothetical protein